LYDTVGGHVEINTARRETEEQKKKQSDKNKNKTSKGTHAFAEKRYQMPRHGEEKAVTEMCGYIAC